MKETKIKTQAKLWLPKRACFPTTETIEAANGGAECPLKGFDKHIHRQCSTEVFYCKLESMPLINIQKRRYIFSKYYFGFLNSEFQLGMFETF